MSSRSARRAGPMERKTSAAAGQKAAGASPHPALAAARTVVTLFAAAGGVACFMLLTAVHLNSVVALLLGLGFALLARQATMSVAGEWMLARARRAAGRDGDAPAPGRQARP